MKRFALSLCTFLVAGLASAHDFWIEPSTFRPATGMMVTAALRVGQKFQGDPLPRLPLLIDRFILKSASGEVPFAGRAGADPAGAATIGDGGLHWIGYQSNPYPVTLDARKFEDYLREEGLERIIDERAKRGESAVPGRERFYRCAKALLDSPGKTGAFGAPLGFALELVPRKNPYATRPGDVLPLSLTFRGKPAANVLVVAMSRDHPGQAVRARTDGRGQVTLRFAHAGIWLVKAVYMQAAPPGAGVEWESWWASLTFDLAR